MPMGNPHPDYVLSNNFFLNHRVSIFYVVWWYFSLRQIWVNSAPLTEGIYCSLGSQVDPFPCLQEVMFNKLCLMIELERQFPYNVLGNILHFTNGISLSLCPNPCTHAQAHVCACVGVCTGDQTWDVVHVREAVLTLGCMPTLMASGLLGFMVASYGNSALSKSFCLFLWAFIRNIRFLTAYFFCAGPIPFRVLVIRR